MCQRMRGRMKATLALVASTFTHIDALAVMWLVFEVGVI